MHAALSVHGYHLAFFQETRVQTAGISENSDFWILSSSADSHGREGCQVWLHKKSAIAHGDKYTWQRESFTIVHAEPRILIVVVEAAGLKFCLVSAHAPTSKQHQTVIHAWWQHLRACLRKAPAACIPILGVDANAKFEQDSRCPDTLGAPPKDCNAECLVSFASSCGLWISGQFGSDLSPLTSWVSPTGSRCLLDYILAPHEWCTAAKTEPTPTLCHLHSDIDHKPVACTLCPRLCLKPPLPRKHVNWRALDTLFGQQVALFALQTAPAIAWDVDSTSHVAQLHEHFVAVASQWLPAPPRERREIPFSQPPHCSSSLTDVLSGAHIAMSKGNSSVPFWPLVSSAGSRRLADMPPPLSRLSLNTTGQGCAQLDGLWRSMRRSDVHEQP